MAVGRRPHSETVSLPVYTSTRAFRRTCSEPWFPFRQVERDTVTLRDAPIQFRWHAGPGRGESPPPDAGMTRSPLVRNSPARDFDPHRTGFGPIAKVAQKERNPLACTIVAGLIGSQPLEATRGRNLEVEEDLVDHGDDMERFFPVRNHHGGPDSTPPPIHPLPHTPQQPPIPKPRFPNLMSFLGYFRGSNPINPVQHRKSYSQIVQSKPQPTVMVYPVRGRSGGRDGFEADRQG